jgi:hypothetical protein
MPQPRGQKRIPGHRLRIDFHQSGCECGWWPPAGTTRARALVLRGRHLVDVRMAAAE